MTNLIIQCNIDKSIVDQASIILQNVGLTFESAVNQLCHQLITQQYVPHASNAITIYKPFHMTIPIDDQLYYQTQAKLKPYHMDMIQLVQAFFYQIVHAHAFPLQLKLSSADQSRLNGMYGIGTKFDSIDDAIKWIDNLRS